MIQDAINTLVELLDQYPALFKIEIVERDNIVLHWSDEYFHQEEFESVQDMLLWLEKKFPE